MASVILAQRSGSFAISPGKWQAWEKKKIFVRRFHRGGQYLIGRPEPLGWEFSLWRAINPAI